MNAATPSVAPPSGSACLHAAAREALEDAAPFALAAAAILIALALVAEQVGWQALGQSLWWMWLVVAAPYLVLAGTLLLGLNRLVRHDHRREISLIGLLTVVWVFNALGVVVLVASLIAHSATRITGAQLLASGGAVWLTNTIAFGLAFWELDCGGPVARALATEPRKPDFQFPQDENPQLARDGGAPRLWEARLRPSPLTNATAFSPTDAMPLTRTAKALMAAESMLSLVTVLLLPRARSTSSCRRSGTNAPDSSRSLMYSTICWSCFGIGNRTFLPRESGVITARASGWARSTELGRSAGKMAARGQ